MAKMYPFRGYRYDQSTISDISQVVTQPYDKISPKLKKEYQERHPSNIVRIILNSDYLEAASLWHRWIQTSVLVQDSRPCLYIYRQDWTLEGEEISRTGIIGLVSLDDDDLVVKGHETILDKPLEDRLRMIRATEANEGLIFTLYSDKDLKVDQALDSITGKLSPAIDMTDDFNVRNRVWCLHEEKIISTLTGLFRENPLYIADGHHRYQTSILYNRECGDKNWLPGAPESFDKRMIATFNMESPGLRILATHRAVRNVSGFDPQSLIKKAGNFFKAEKFESLQRLREALSETPHSIGLLVGKQTSFYLLSLRQGALEDGRFMPGVNGCRRELDVTILHQAIFEDLLGIDAEQVTSGEHVSYFRDSDDLAASVRSGRNQAGFVLRPTSLEDVRRISEAGERMPQKSTDFFPKLLTGLVMMKMEIEK